ncbi:MAG: DUF2156 domain-containing protein [Gemmatimonadaceae bacterium]|nr:DUF2156 domain-containing protein [Gemmatimonadaceae bacterium]
MGDDLRRWCPPAALGPAMVAYADMPGAMVAAGEPIAPLEHVVPVAEAFVREAIRQHRRPSFFATEGRLVTSTQLQRRLVGEQPVWNPQEWGAHLRRHRSLREQIRRARAKGVRIHAINPTALTRGTLGPAVQALITRWQATHGLAPMSFLVTIDLTTRAESRQCWVAIQDDRLVALLAMAPVASRDAEQQQRGWLLEHLLRDPDAPNGTAELLVDHAMRTMAQDGVTWATLGLAPLHGSVDRWLQRARRWSRPLFNFEGLSAFKRKLGPDHWEPIYLAWPREHVGWRALVDGLRAFANGSLWRFAMQTILRGPRLLLQILAWLLVPWTLVLAMAPVTPWFPARAVQVSWLLFDVLLLLTLFVLSQRTASSGARSSASRTWTARLATWLAVAVTADATLTAVQAGWFVQNTTQSDHLSLASSICTWLVVLIACAGPAVTAPILWGAARRLHILATPGPCLAPQDISQRSPGVSEHSR